jgi:hypothetical protein
MDWRLLRDYRQFPFFAVSLKDPPLWSENNQVRTSAGVTWSMAQKAGRRRTVVGRWLSSSA